MVHSCIESFDNQLCGNRERLRTFVKPQGAFSTPCNSHIALKIVKLKNADQEIKLDDHVYAWLVNSPELIKVDFINNLRLHSSGCAVFQKTRKVEKGQYNTETIYLHKYVAEHFLKEFKDSRRNLVGALNGDKLDCQLENLVYRSRSVASRKRKTSNKAGYTGVYQENNRYRAVISHQGKSLHLGMYSSPEEAAIAYNRKSWELFEGEGKLNDLPEELWKPTP